MDAPRDDLIRNVEFDVVRVAADADGLTLEGYAAVFDSPTEINSWEGNFIETVQRGAFAKSIQERTPVLMFNHGQHSVIGDMPIGVITKIREDNRGLKVTARLASNWLVEPVREAIEAGAVDGMSFRFSVNKDKWEEPSTRSDLPRRTLTEVFVSELGPVVFPAYPDTTVGVRSREIVEALSDSEVRSDLARALYAVRADTPKEAAPEGTSGGAVSNTDEQPSGHSDATTRKQAALMAVARLNGVIDDG